MDAAAHPLLQLVPAEVAGREDRITVVFFGDAAVEEGAFYESLNFASVRSLPILFVCEDNEFSIFTPRRYRQPIPQTFR